MSQEKISIEVFTAAKILSETLDEYLVCGATRNQLMLAKTHLDQLINSVKI